MGVVTYPTLEHVAMEARPYPAHLLEGCETGLVLFAAAFLGHNDAIHFAEHVPYVTCVDTDTERLNEMKALYPGPPAFSFINGDAWDYASHVIPGFFDAVSADTFTGDMMRRSLGSLDLWCELASRVVTVTIDDTVDSINVPEGWESFLYPRSERVSWLVLTRA